MKSRVQKRWGKGDDMSIASNPSPLVHDPLSPRRKLLWERAFALGLGIADAAAYVAAILRSEQEGEHAPV